MALCDYCKYFTDKCEHKSNVRIKLERRIEKKTYISLEKKNSCWFFCESEPEIKSIEQKQKSNKNICRKKK